MKKIINTKTAPQPIGPYSQAININDTLILSGQIPIEPKSNYIPENISEQTYIVLMNIKNIVTASKFSIKDIVKITIFTTDLKKIHIINEIYTKFFIDNNAIFPARSCVEVSSLPKNVKIEMEAIACKNNEDKKSIEK